MTRRQSLKLAAAALLAAPAAWPADSSAAPARRMTINLMCGMIGVNANQREAVELAARHNFESVEAMPADLARMSGDELSSLLGLMRERGIVFGAASLPADFRKDEALFSEGLKQLRPQAAAMQKAGVTRVGTWLMPGHNSLTYLQNFQQHAKRLREIARVLGDHGCRLGLEYVGTRSLRRRFRYEFAHTLAETRELIAEIGGNKVGFVLDSWHWWNADETADEITPLRASDVVAVDLNDAPAGLPKDQQIDGQRELPLATGVIDVRAFLRALAKIGYDGPVRAEPFSKALNELDNDAACAKTSEAMHRAFALLAES